LWGDGCVERRPPEEKFFLAGRLGRGGFGGISHRGRRRPSDGGMFLNARADPDEDFSLQQKEVNKLKLDSGSALFLLRKK